jgi:hypothetical protein
MYLFILHLISQRFNLYIALILLSIYSCANNNIHSFILDRNENSTAEIKPPKHTNKVAIYGNGKLICESKVNIYMDGELTNFADDIYLSGLFKDSLLLMQDWYENKLKIELTPIDCIDSKFNLKIIFL